MSNSKRNPQRIVYAAYKMKDGLIITGARHFSPAMTAVMTKIYGETPFTEIHPDFLLGGFVNQFEALFL
jgi:hypothetical protein